MKNIEQGIFNEKESRLVHNYFLSPYERSEDFFLPEEEKGLLNLGTGPKCLK